MLLMHSNNKLGLYDIALSSGKSKSVKIIAYQVCYLHYLVHMCAQFNGPITMYMLYVCTCTMKMNANIATLIL